MADSRALKLLLVEDDLEDEQLLCEALIEIEETCSVQLALIEHNSSGTPRRRLGLLARQTFDIILLNLSLPDSPTLLDSFLATNAAARARPSSFWRTSKMKTSPIGCCEKAPRMCC